MLIELTEKQLSRVIYVMRDSTSSTDFVIAQHLQHEKNRIEGEYAHDIPSRQEVGKKIKRFVQTWCYTRKIPVGDFMKEHVRDVTPTQFYQYMKGMSYPNFAVVARLITQGLSVDVFRHSPDFEENDDH